MEINYHEKLVDWTGSEQMPVLKRCPDCGREQYRHPNAKYCLNSRCRHPLGDVDPPSKKP